MRKAAGDHFLAIFDAIATVRAFASDVCRGTVPTSRSMPSAFQPRFPTLSAIFENSTRKYADRPLFGTKSAGRWSWMTYGEFAEEVGAIRAGLAALGVMPGDRVAIIANNRPEWATVAHATYGLGAACVPMHESQLPSEWRYILKDSGARVVVVSSQAIRELVMAARAEPSAGLGALEMIVTLEPGGSDRFAAGAGVVSWSALRARGRASPTSVRVLAPTDVAAILYTSGTTGEPKGVVLTHANLASNVSAMHEVFPMRPEDRSLSFLPWAHSFGQTVELHMLFSMGASMGIAEGPDAILENLEEVRPTLLFSVPRVFQRIYERVHAELERAPSLHRRLFDAAMANVAARRRLAEKRRTSGVTELKHRIFDRLVFQRVRDLFGGQLRYAFSGGATLSKEVAEFIDDLGVIVYEGYGLTETSPIATANWPGARKIGSVGKAIPGVRIEIDRSVTGEGRIGEIVVYGHNVMRGYHGLPEESARVLTADGGLRTGDLGYLDEDGFLYVTGRIKEQYKLENGKAVAPAPLEERLKLSPYVSNVMVWGDGKPYNVALVVPNLPEVERWASARGLPESGAALLSNENVHALFRDEIDRCSSEFRQFEKIKKFHLLAEDFTVENGLLTPKASLKRRVAAERYRQELERLYT